METQKSVELATQIFTEHESAIRAMIRRHVGNREEEEDIYQNLFFKAENSRYALIVKIRTLVRRPQCSLR